MLPWATTCWPSRLPAAGTHWAPVNEATSPLASTTATWRYADSGSDSTRWDSTARAEPPSRIAARPRGPKPTLTKAWVATPPRPGSSQPTSLPTPKKWDWQA